MWGEGEEGATKEHQETFRDDEYVHYPDCGIGSMGVHMPELTYI